jgi:hemerythrin-like domain-containing protein
MTDAFSVLSEDHRRLLHMANQLTGGSAESSGSPSERQRLAKQLVILGSKHEAVEEIFFWPMVRRRVEGGDNLADAALHQEVGAKRLLHELDHVSAATDDFRSLVLYVASVIRDHITLEESQVWPKVQLAVGASELQGLGEEMQKARAVAPTRPHPHTPPSPGAQKTVGSLAAVVDRARDAVTGRGR